MQTAHTATSLERMGRKEFEAKAVVSDASLTDWVKATGIPLFENAYGKVKTDRVIAPSGMPPAEWSLS